MTRAVRAPAIIAIARLFATPSNAARLRWMLAQRSVHWLLTPAKGCPVALQFRLLRVKGRSCPTIATLLLVAKSAAAIPDNGQLLNSRHCSDFASTLTITLHQTKMMTFNQSQMKFLGLAIHTPCWVSIHVHRIRFSNTCGATPLLCKPLPETKTIGMPLHGW